MAAVPQQPQQQWLGQVQQLPLAPPLPQVLPQTLLLMQPQKPQQLQQPQQLQCQQQVPSAWLVSHALRGPESTRRSLGHESRAHIAHLVHLSGSQTRAHSPSYGGLGHPRVYPSGSELQASASRAALVPARSPRELHGPVNKVGAFEGAGATASTATKLETKYPATGKPMVLKLMCLHSDMSEPLRISNVEGHQVTSDWTLEHLLQASEMATGVHRASQKLFHAGKEMAPGSTIREAIGLGEKDLPDWYTVHVLVDDDRFPRRLDPFGLTAVTLKADDFILPSTSKTYGFHWIMLNEVVERLGVRSTGDNQVTAQCSPSTPITLSEEERASVGIPPEAVEFVWSYPVANWDKVDKDPHLLEDWENGGANNLAVKDFLAVGGFMYFDRYRRLVHVAASLSNKARKGGMQFASPRKWDHAWTPAILEDGRFHRVTIGPLREAGAHYFCWLLPGERFTDEDGRPLASQPEVPHGGFAYIFHELNATSAQDLVVDCYFAVAALSGIAPGNCESFALLGEERPSELLGHTSAQLNHHSMCVPEA